MKEIPKHDSIRGEFAYQLYRQMDIDPSIRIITADLGFGMFDIIKQDYPDRFFNAGASEQCAMGIAAGMALSGLKPFLYSITPFLLKRPFETISLYLEHEQIPVRLVGGGVDDDYKHDGFSHHFFKVEDFCRANFPNITLYKPYLKAEVGDLVNNMVETDKPSLLILKR